MLTPDDFALIGIVTIFIAFSQVMVDSEMGGALLRKKTVSNADYSTLFYYNLLVSIVIYIILYIAAPLIADFYSRPPLTDIIRVIGLTIIIHAFRVVQRIIIFRDLKFNVYAVINVVSGLLSLAAAIIIVKAGYGYWALVWQQVVLAIANVILMQLYNKFIPSLTFSKESFRYQFSFGISLLGSDTIRTIAGNVSTNIIAKISTMQITGYYTQTSKITGFCQSTLSALMNQTVFPMLVKLGTVAKVTSVYHKLIVYASLALLAVTLIFIFFATPIIRIALGDEWVNASGIFILLSLTILPTSLQTLSINIMKTLGCTKKVLELETIKSTIVIVSLLVASLWGVNAVIWAFVISQAFCCLIWMLATEKLLKDRRDMNLNPA